MRTHYSPRRLDINSVTTATLQNDAKEKGEEFGLTVGTPVEKAFSFLGKILKNFFRVAFGFIFRTIVAICNWLWILRIVWVAGAVAWAAFWSVMGIKILSVGTIQVGIMERLYLGLILSLACTIGIIITLIRENKAWCDKRARPSHAKFQQKTRRKGNM